MFNKRFSITKFWMLALIITAGLLTISSCDKDDDETVSKTALATAIDNAEDLIANAQEGTADGNYIIGSKATLQTAIDLAQGVFDDADATQTEVDNAVIALNNAMTVFGDSTIVPIDPDNLNGHWTFDEGTGTSVSDYSGNNLTGTFGNEPGFGADQPVWTTDRYGNANQALLFNNGAKVTIPYNTLINPAKMSVSLWVNAKEIRGNNRFMGLHSWNGYKFQLQDGNKSFFTASTSDGIWDRDTDPPLELDTWYQLVVTMGDGNMTFYINGTKTTTWDNTPGTMVAVADHDLVFGVGSSKFAATPDNYDIDKIIPLDWGGYFYGSLDEIRIYKSVLTDSQVSSIYEAEKVN